MDKAKYLLGPYDKYLLGPYDGVWFGVLGIPKDHSHAELHGVFTTREEANTERESLLDSFSDYESVKVVRIDMMTA